MRPQNVAFHVAAGSLLAMAIGSFAGACSSNANGGNPSPSTEDASTDVTSSGSSGGSSGGSGGSSGGSGSSSGGGLTDAPSFDTGSCVSDASACNSCYSAVQAAADPYNACSPYTVNCTKFDNTRVPLIDGGVPPVP